MILVVAMSVVYAYNIHSSIVLYVCNISRAAAAAAAAAVVVAMSVLYAYDFQSSVVQYA